MMHNAVGYTRRRQGLYVALAWLQCWRMRVPIRQATWTHCSPQLTSMSMASSATDWCQQRNRRDVIIGLASQVRAMTSWCFKLLCAQKHGVSMAIVACACLRLTSLLFLAVSANPGT